MPSVPENANAPPYALLAILENKMKTLNAVCPPKSGSFRKFMLEAMEAYRPEILMSGVIVATYLAWLHLGEFSL